MMGATVQLSICILIARFLFHRCSGTAIAMAEPIIHQPVDSTTTIVWKRKILPSRNAMLTKQICLGTVCAKESRTILMSVTGTKAIVLNSTRLTLTAKCSPLNLFVIGWCSGGEYDVESCGWDGMVETANDNIWSHVDGMVETANDNIWSFKYMYAYTV